MVMNSFSVYSYAVEVTEMSLLSVRMTRTLSGSTTVSYMTVGIESLFDSPQCSPTKITMVSICLERYKTECQLSSVTQQLNDGIRMLQLQAHNNGGTIQLCHTSCVSCITYRVLVVRIHGLVIRAYSMVEPYKAISNQVRRKHCNF